MMLSLRSLSLPISALTLHRARRRISEFVSRTADWAFFIGVVLIGGLGTSWYMVEIGSSVSTATFGPWTTWPAAARVDADPYTRAHHSRLGLLPLSAEFAQTYVARTDSDGIALHSSCDYVIEGREIATHWWSLTVFDAQGRLIPNQIDRYSFTSDTIAIGPAGTYTVVLGRDARAGNWLPIGGGGRLAVALTVLDTGARRIAEEGDVVKLLPTIRKARC